MSKNKIPSKYEIRSFTSKIEAKQEEQKRYLYGFIPYNSTSEALQEVIEPSAFKKSIQERSVVALINHDTNKVLGSSKNNTVIFNNTDEGLYIQVELPDTTYAKDAYTIIERGDIDTLSFGFQPVKVETRDGKDFLKEVKLFEVSFMVAFPAYEETGSIAYQRSLFETVKEKRSIDFENVSNILSKENEEITPEEIEQLEKAYEAFRTILSTELKPKVEVKQEEPAEPVEPLNNTLLDTLNKLVELETMV